MRIFSTVPALAKLFLTCLTIGLIAGLALGLQFASVHG